MTEPVEQIVLIATSWGHRHGGINALNTDLCIALREVLPTHYRVSCVALVADDNDRRQALDHGISLLSLSPTEVTSHVEENRAFEMVNLVRSAGKVSWWIGHDVISGGAALQARDIVKDGKVAILHHMNYFAYSGFKHSNGRAVTEREERQRDVLARADQVFAVGPRLLSSAEFLCGSREHISMLVPGLPPIIPRELSPPNFRALVFGRMDLKDDIIKQGRLAVAALGKAIQDRPSAFNPDPSVTVIGVPEAERHEAAEELKRVAAENAKRLVNTVVVPYVEDRDVLFERIRNSSACLMLSLHEGFGLAGWEAIAAGVPLVVTRNSGLIDLLSEILGGSGLGCVRIVDVDGAAEGEQHFSQKDLATVAQALVSLADNLHDAKRDALRLRTNLQAYTWKQTAVAFASACNLSSVFVGGDTPGQYVHQILEGADDSIEEYVTKRERHFQDLWVSLEQSDGEDSRLVLFGGISTHLRGRGAAERYAVWLIRNPRAKLFVCYETGKAAELRAASLDPDRLGEQEGLPTTALERMREKEKQVQLLGTQLEAIAGPAVIERIFFVPVEVALTTYAILTTHDLYVSPVLQVRSALTASMKLSRRRSEIRLQFLSYIRFVLSQCSGSPAVLMLDQEITDASEEDWESTATAPAKTAAAS